MLVRNFDLSQFLIFAPQTRKGNYTNSTGSTVVISFGRLIGRITSSGLLLPQVSTATDGSQAPIGASCAEYTVLAGETAEVTYVSAGQIAGEFVGLGGADTLATNITNNSTNLGTIDDILAGRGLFIKGAVNLTYVDTQ